MKNFLIAFLLAALFCGCDPSYGCYVRNKDSAILYLKTHPSIESLFEEKSSGYDSILTYKVKQEENLSVYKVAPKSTFRIFGHIGFRPALQEVPFDYIEIIHGSDTVVLDSQEKILQRLKQEGRTREYFIQD